MKRSIFQVRVLWKLIIAFVLALCLVLASLNSVAALSPQDYFSFSYNVQFSSTQITGNALFQATVVAEATCINDLPVSATEASFTSRIVAEHQVSGTKVTLNPSYTITIDPFPSQSGQTTRIEKVISLQFPQGSASGSYNVVVELIEAKVGTFLGWLTVTSYLPASQAVGSITYVATGSVGGGGGGGGLGGAGLGGAAATAPSTSVAISGLSASVNLQVNSSGIVMATSRLEVLSMGAYLDIAGGTKILDAQGKALSTLSASKIEQPPASSAGTALIAAVDLGPDGTVFDPAITIILSYDPAVFPQGVTEDELYIAYWDNSRWLALPSAIDTNAKTASAAISHFTQFAVIGKLSSSQALSPSASPSPSASVSPSASPSPSASVSPSASPSPSASASPSLSPDVPPPPPLPALEPASFTISTLAISPGQVEPAQEVTISAVVTNVGSGRGEHIVVLKINGIEESRKRVIFDALVTQKVSFDPVKKNSAGEYQVDVNGLTGSFMVKEAAVKPVSSPPETPLPLKQPQPFSRGFIAGIIAGVMISGLVIWLVVRRRTA